MTLKQSLNAKAKVMDLERGGDWQICRPEGDEVVTVASTVKGSREKGRSHKGDTEYKVYFWK